ncbi:MAG TPA: AMP-binding protein [Xanthobacteraceae bacterium]|jgi:long-chain acyl-CoA synthetase|nr:AMP-binding protein [Xanthobacteraceae bacterium]
MAFVTQMERAKAGAAEPNWFSSYPPGVPKSIDPDIYPSLTAMLLEACRKNAERPAFECLGARMSYADWDRDSRDFAAFLIEEAGCRSGDRVAIMLPNMFAYPVTFLGTLRAGLTVVNVNPLYTPRELQQQLADSGATVIVIMENFAHKLQQIIGATKIRHVVVARLGDFVPVLKRWAFNFANSYIRHAVPAWQFETYTMLQEACDRAPGETYRDALTRPGDVALLQYTGGTTGVPKGAMLTHRNLVANTLQCHAWIGTGVNVEHERVLTPLPLYHIFSLTANLLSFAMLGGLNYLIPDPRDLRRLIRVMAEAKITWMSGVNTLFNALTNVPEFAELDFSALRVAVAGGAAIQSEVARRWRDITGSEVVEGYGLTETSPVVCINPFLTPKLGTVGLPLPSTEVTIRDDAGKVLAVGEEGEVWVRGPQVMLGYWQQKAETDRVLSADGWLRTGDLGAFDAQGFLKLLDRKKDLVNVSGFKVFPNEVEDVAVQHPGVLEAAVIGVPDARTGQAVKLFIVKRDPALDAADLKAFLHERLAGYKRPAVIEFAESLPKSNIGKILRKELH